MELSLRGIKARLLVSALGMSAVVAGLLSISASAQSQISLSERTRGWLGIYVLSDSSGYPILQSVEPGSPAQAAGLAAGDTILSFNGNDARFKYDKLLAAIKPGERFVFKLRKNGIRTVSVTAAKKTSMEVFFNIKEDSNSSSPLKRGQISFPFPIQLMQFELDGDQKVSLQTRFVVAGAEVADVNPDLATILRFKGKGLLVLNVVSASPAQESGLKSGDVIIKADSFITATVMALVQAIQKMPERKMALEIVRQGKMEKRTLRW